MKSRLAVTAVLALGSFGGGTMNLARATVAAGFALATASGAVAACKSTCTEELRACRTGCASAGGGERRACRRRCAEQSTCNASDNRLRLAAFVVTECTADAAGVTTFTQKLVARRGNCDLVTLTELPPVGPVQDPFIGLGGICRIYGDFRTGFGSVSVGGFQRVAVLPDASAVVFELNARHSLDPPLSPVLPQGEGIFVVRPDGSGLRRLGPATNAPILVVVPDPSSPLGVSFAVEGATVLPASPNSRLITFLDTGPSPDGEDALQVVVLDVTSGERRTVTRLPGVQAGQARTCCPAFIDDRTIKFFDGPIASNARVKVDGTGLEPISGESVEGGRVVPQFAVAGGAATRLLTLAFPDVVPAKTFGPSSIVNEIFILDGPRLLQLTSFGYPDTNAFTFAGSRVFITASANPVGKNPTENCQLFSMDPLAGHLRQLTSFRDEGRMNLGCVGSAPGAACSFSGGGSQDRQTGYVAFGSQCDPFGRNPYGEQYFSIRPDGSGLRQITSFRGRELLPDGGVHVELGGPVAQAVVY